MAFGMLVLSPALAQVAPAPSKDTANSSEKIAPKADEGTGAHPSKSKKTASTVAPAPSHDTANSSEKLAPKADEGTGANSSQKKSP